MPNCSLCSKTYARAEHLRRHFDTAHPVSNGTTTPRKENRCNYPGCGRAFLRSDALLRHKRGHERNNEAGKQMRGMRGVGGQYSANATPKGHGRMSPASNSMEQLSISSSSGQGGMHLEQQQQQSMWSAVTRDGTTDGDRTSKWTQQTLADQEQGQFAHAQFSATSPHRSTHFYMPSMETEDTPAWSSSGQDFVEEQRQRQSQQPQQPSFVNSTNFGLLDGMGYHAVETGSAGSMGDHNFGGLDWIFDDLTEMSGDTSTMPELVSAFENDWQGRRMTGQGEEIDTRDNDNIFGGSNTERDTTETLNLINLANTALYMTSTNKRVLSRRGGEVERVGSGQNISSSQQQREDDGATGEDSWPQEYRPLRKKPPTVELSAFSLTSHIGVDINMPVVAAQDRMVLIDDMEEEKGSAPRWVVTADTRLKLLSYLTHSCRHPWSIYSFSSTPPATFLTTFQLEKLVDLYFTRFHPYVPLLHAPTFEPGTVPPILLLVVVTIGLVFYPSEMGRPSNSGSKISSFFLHLRKTTSTLAIAFSELVRIGVMSAYEADQRGFTDISINQAWILQQIIGLGSGDKRLTKLAERNRGGIVTAIRRLGLLYQAREPPLPSTAMMEEQSQESAGGESSLQALWRSWITSESKLRLGWFVYLYDQKFSCYLDMAPMFLYTEVGAPMPCHADLWNAETFDVWTQRCRKSRTLETFGPKNLLSSLRQLLRPSVTAPPLHLNPLEAYILAVTLYRVRWDASKEKILFDDSSKGDTSLNLDISAAKAMEKLSEAAAIRSIHHNHNAVSSAIPLSIDVQLLHLLGKLHFTGPPLIFDKLRDAAGRSGMQSGRRQEAILWLREWMGVGSSSRIAMRKMLLAASQVFVLVQSSIKVGGGSGDYRLKKTGMQSNICTMSLFHAALGMWAYTQFVDKIGPAKEEENNSSDLPRVSSKSIEVLCEIGYLDIVWDSGRSDDDEEDDQSMTQNTRNSTRLLSAEIFSQLMEAWLRGRYVSLEDEKVYEWPLPPMAVRIAGIGVLNSEQTNKSSSSSHVLERFAILLARHDWGLAASFRLILLHMAKHAVR